MGLNDINSLSHTRWNCKYHIVFAPKYRRKVFYKEKKRLLTINDADGRRFIICYIHHQDGQKH